MNEWASEQHISIYPFSVILSKGSSLVPAFQTMRDNNENMMQAKSLHLHPRLVAPQINYDILSLHLRKGLLGLTTSLFFLLVQRAYSFILIQEIFYLIIIFKLVNELSPTAFWILGSIAWTSMSQGLNSFMEPQRSKYGLPKLVHTPLYNVTLY